MDPEAENYNPQAIYNIGCEYPEGEEPVPDVINPDPAPDDDDDDGLDLFYDDLYGDAGAQDTNYIPYYIAGGVLIAILILTRK